MRHFKKIQPNILKYSSETKLLSNLWHLHEPLSFWNVETANFLRKFLPSAPEFWKKPNVKQETHNSIYMGYDPSNLQPIYFQAIYRNEITPFITIVGPTLYRGVNFLAGSVICQPIIQPKKTHHKEKHIKETLPKTNISLEHREYLKRKVGEVK